MVLSNLQDIISIVHVVNTCASLIIAIISVFILTKTNDKQTSLIIISISSFVITILNLFTELNTNRLLRLEDVSSYYQTNFKNKSVFCLIVFNFLNFAATIAFVDYLISPNNKIIESSKSIKHLVVTDLAFIILQQLTFFSILYSFNSDNQRCDIEDPEAMVMKPMRITKKKTRGIVNKSSEQTLTCDLDFIDSPELNKEKINNTKPNPKWKRVFSTVLKKKPMVADSSMKEEDIASVNTKKTDFYNNSSNINLNSQSDLHHTTSVMLDIDNSKDFMAKNINESFERKIAAEHDAMKKMNKSLLPPRLASKIHTNESKSNSTTDHSSGSRINSGNSTSSNEQDLSQIPGKFHNNLQLFIVNENIKLDHAILQKESAIDSWDCHYDNEIPIDVKFEKKDFTNAYFMDQTIYEEKDAVDMLDGYLTFSKHKKTQLSLDTKSIVMTDEDIMNSALSDDFNHSPTRSLNLMIPKHQKTPSIGSLSPKRRQSTTTYSHKKNSQSMFISGNKHSRKNTNHKLSLSNISFDIDDNGKIDFSTVYKNNNEEFNSIKTVSTANQSNVVLNDVPEDQEENRKISEKSFDYPKVLVSEYDKEKWKNISDYA